MRRLREVLESGTFAVTCEGEPPKGTDTGRLLTNARALAGKVHGMNLTDNQTAVMRMCPLAACRLVYETGIDPIFQVTCRDRNRLAIQSDLLGAHALGIRNILALRGDNPEVGDHKAAKPVFDIESLQLLEVIAGMNAGRDMMGNALNASTDLYPAAAVTPTGPIEPTMANFVKKVEKGARFFQTQAFYDPKPFIAFMDRAKAYPAKVLAGILPVKSAKMARHLNTIPGISVPEVLITRLEGAGSKEAAIEIGLEQAAEMIREIRPHCHGVHIMAVGMESRIPELLQRAGLA